MSRANNIMHDYTKNKIKVCYIAGITRRSGTNFLYQLIKCHPKCWGLGPIWEDFLLTESDKLIEYAHAISSKWSPNWDVPGKMGKSADIAYLLGKSLKGLLSNQLNQSTLSIQLESEPDDAPAEDISILLTKTPDSKGIENFFTLFPEEYLILMVRDGRSAVESGVRTFGWGYEESIKQWAFSAKRIYDFYHRAKEQNQRISLVRYEDIIQNERSVIEGLLNFLELDINEYSFDRSRQIGIFGSSMSGKKIDGRTYWKEKAKDGNFNPLTRFENWEDSLMDKFNSIAGEYMIKLGYYVEKP